jgi:hypothetical protein
MICDFCCGPDPRWRFHAQPFVVDYGGVIQSASDAGWAACDTCCALILADDRARLRNSAAHCPDRRPGQHRRAGSAQPERRYRFKSIGVA